MMPPLHGDGRALAIRIESNAGDRRVRSQGQTYSNKDDNNGFIHHDR